MYEEFIKKILKKDKKEFLKDPKTGIQVIRTLFETLYEQNFIPINIGKRSSQNQKIKKLYYLGYLQLTDATLPVFIFEYSGTVEAKQSLLQDIPKLLLDLNLPQLGIDTVFIENAIGIFIPQKQQERNWKLSLVSAISKESKEYKRHSYILGPEAQIRTPLEKLYLDLHDAITEATLTIEQLKEAFEPEPLTKAFYKDLVNWYYWALEHIEFPIGDGSKDPSKLKQEALVRFITRILFVWFLKQKKLIPNELFDLDDLSSILKKGAELPTSKETIYYKAILQNLFFATLSTPIAERRFRDERRFIKGYNKDFGKSYVYRFLDLFNISPKEVLKLFGRIPFLNGGLFEILDKPKENIYYDGFTECKKYQPYFPDFLFFSPEQNVTLKHDRNRNITVSGLINILKRYHFTVTENTPLDKDVALDPELLGNIFENLLAEQLDETAENARKSTGSFYTPHEIVDFMVEESLKEYLKTHLQGDKSKIEEYLNTLFDQTTRDVDLKSYEKLNQQTLKLLSTIKIIDPAVGSGAFPMGILNKMVFLLKKLDPDNKKWLREQLEKIDQIDLPYGIKEEQKKDLLETFESKGKTDYFRKLYLIRDSIYGVDIQPIAIQIARLRFFLSLIIEEEPKFSKPEDNFGIQPLPNLYMNFVIANSLVPLDYTMSKENPLKGQTNQLQMNIDSKIENAKQKLINITKELFWASDPKLREELKKKEKKLRIEFAEALKGNFNKDYERIINWDPYNPHKSADWFDPLFMLRVEEGFDVVIANPPYVSTKGVDRQTKQILKKYYGFADDLYSHFYFLGFKLLKPKGILTYISSKTFWTIQTKKNLRDLLLKNRLIAIVDVGNPFEAPMVDTSIIIAQRINPTESNNVTIIDAKNNVKKIDHLPKYIIPQTIYQTTANNVFFVPTKYNMQLYKKLAMKVKPLLDKWWPLIETSRKIKQNEKTLEAYRKTLKPGDITLLGLITEGGQGLATADNGRFVGVLETFSLAHKIREERPKRLWKFIQKYQPEELNFIKSKADAIEYVNKLTEKEIRELFESLKQKYGRDIFGQGWLYKIVSKYEIADVDNLNDNEKLNGILGNKTWVPYDKGDKEGNRWWAPTPYYINWSRKNVKFLKKNSGKRGKGMPVVRNPQFYFKEGFCWNNVTGDAIKARLKGKNVYSTEAMSLFSLFYQTPTYYLVALLNSSLLAKYKNLFINSTVHLTTNDAKQLPIVVPTRKQLEIFKRIFTTGYQIQKDKFSGKISKEEAEVKLNKLQEWLDKEVNRLYGIDNE